MKRRAFAGFLGASAFGAVLGAGWRRRALGQPARGPLRFLGVRTPHGTDRSFWIPRESSGEAPRAPDESLGRLTFDYEEAILASLEPWREQVTIVDGIDTQMLVEDDRDDRHHEHGHHEQGTMLTGACPPSRRSGVEKNFDGHPSLDVALHERFEATALPVAMVGGDPDFGQDRDVMSFDPRGEPIRPTKSPIALHEQLFGGLSEDDLRPAIDPAAEALWASQHRALVERLRLRLSGAEEEKLRAHLEGMDQALASPDACTIRPPVPTHDAHDFRRMDGARGTTREHAAVIASAFQCGLARAATLQILDHTAGGLPTDHEAHVRNFHTNIVHAYWGADTPAWKRQAYRSGLRWLADRFADVLEVLDGMVDPYDPSGGSILDNTIVYWHSEFGRGPHDRAEILQPVVLAGGGGAIRLGRYVRVREIELCNRHRDCSGERVSHNRVLTTIAQAMGWGTDYFGDRAFGDRAAYRGPIAALLG